MGRMKAWAMELEENSDMDWKDFAKEYGSGDNQRSVWHSTRIEAGLPITADFLELSKAQGDNLKAYPFIRDDRY